MPKGRPLEDLTGRRFGMLTVTSVNREKAKGTVFWNCVCDCGKEDVAYGSDMKAGRKYRCIQCSKDAAGLKKRKINKSWIGEDGFLYVDVSTRAIKNKTLKLDPDLSEYIRGKTLSVSYGGGAGLYYVFQTEHGSRKQNILHREVMKTPEGMVVDHINGDPLDCTVENMRNVPQSENTKNIRRVDRNTSGHMGVGWHKRIGAWQVRIGVDGKPLHIGYFKTLDEAVAARDEAEMKYHYHDNHGRLLKATED